MFALARFLPLLLAGCAAATPPARTEASARGAAWSADAAAFLADLRAHHPRPDRFASWAELERLAADVGAGEASEAERAARMATLVARIGDGHTVMPLLDLPFPGIPASPTTRLLPLRFEQFDDGLFVVGAATPYRALLGMKVEAMGSQPIAPLLDRVRRLLPTGTPRFAQEYAPEWLMSDVVLSHLGVLHDDAVEVRAGGKSIAVALRHKEGIDWLRARTAGAYPDWVEETDPAPLGDGVDGVGLLAPRTLYWKIVELRSSDGGSWSDTLDDVFGQFDAMKGDKLILDLRDHIGGDGSLVPQILERLDRPELRKPGALTILIGRRCHSACVMLVSALEKRGDLRFAGQPTGDAPNHVGETNIFVLPHSGYPVVRASEWYVTTTPADARPFKAPDVLFPSTHADFAAGRDPALAWALQQKVQP